MADKASFTLEAARKIARMYREWNASGMDFQQARQVVAAPSENGPFIGIAQADIDPNTSGSFKFARGAKGGETAYGNEYDGYYRTSSDSGAIPEDAFVYVVWINDGWELTPVECPE